MNAWITSLLGMGLGAIVAGAAPAAELVGLAPFSGAAWGQQSDASSPPAYAQVFVAPNGTLLEKIRWWGFHGQYSEGPDYDDFVVTLDGQLQSGKLTVTNLSPLFSEYTLDIDDVVLAASSLSVFNASLDVEWYWQSAASASDRTAADAQNVSFSLIGRRVDSSVDEPAVVWLLAAALLPMAWARRRQTTRRDREAGRL
ncbi:MAG: hypothetical protein IH627_00930 [Rubrivivax sp.]|nr:hypothetical protein [Rubrivivax sp.]